MSSLLFGNVFQNERKRKVHKVLKCNVVLDKQQKQIKKSFCEKQRKLFSSKTVCLFPKCKKERTFSQKTLLLFRSKKKDERQINLSNWVHQGFFPKNKNKENVGEKPTSPKNKIKYLCQTGKKLFLRVKTKKTSQKTEHVRIPKTNRNFENFVWNTKRNWE